MRNLAKSTISSAVTGLFRQGLAFLCLMACSHADLPLEGPPPPITLEQATLLPMAFSAEENLLSDQNWLKVHAQALPMMVVARPSITVREGPGVDYALRPQVYPQGKSLMEIGKHGQWRKILDPFSGHMGWVHGQTVRAAVKENAAQYYLLRPSWLPRGFAVAPITQGFHYPSGKPIAVAIPQRTIFHTLHKGEKRSLVILAQTQTPIWLPAEVLK